VLSYPYLGFGLGLRTDHYAEILAAQHEDRSLGIDWFEILTENYLVPGGKPLYYLDKICENYPVVMHGVSLSIGSSEPLNKKYLKNVKALAERTQARWISDHLCWTGVGGKNLHDLLPLPYTPEVLDYVCSRILQVQDFLGQALVLENVSSYLTFAESTYSEWDFLAEIVKRTDCLLLLDINNIFVSAYNHKFDAKQYLTAIPAHKVQQFHLAGHGQCADLLIDTHDHDILEPVWQLYELAVQRFGAVSTAIERDANVPPLQYLLEELGRARDIAEGVLIP